MFELAMSVSIMMIQLSCLFCRYRRIFSVGTRGITTYNPSDREITNQVGQLYVALSYVVSHLHIWG